jgi:type I restriction-modification system DNA methylase subunit
MTDFSTRYDRTADVLARLEAITQFGFGRFDVFRDWTRLMTHALARDDDAYLDVLDRYADANAEADRGDRPADHFAAAFGELRAATTAVGGDVLGDAYEAYGMASDAFGQHFSPPAVVRLLAALQDVGTTDGEGVTQVSDPACGSGRLLLAGIDAADGPVVCLGVDKDEVCARMAALNCCLANVDAVVVHGDALTFEGYGAWRTSRTASGGALEAVDPEAVGFD